VSHIQVNKTVHVHLLRLYRRCAGDVPVVGLASKYLSQLICISHIVIQVRWLAPLLCTKLTNVRWLPPLAAVLCGLLTMEQSA